MTSLLWLLACWETGPSAAEQAQGPLCEQGDINACYRLGAAYQHGQGGTRIDLAKAKGLFEQGCAKEHALSCNDLGVLYGTGQGVAQDDAQAAELYGTACRLNDAMACTNLASFRASGTGVEKDTVESERLYEKACSLGDLGGCRDLALKQAIDPEFTHRPEVAVNTLRRLCEEHDDGQACADWGYLTKKGIGTVASESEGAALFKKACNMGYMRACGAR